MTRGIIALVFRCKITGGTLTTTDEAPAYRWATDDDVRNLSDEAYAIRVLDALQAGHPPRFASTTAYRFSDVWDGWRLPSARCLMTCGRQIRMGQNVWMTISADDSGPVRIVTAVLRDGDRVLLCHRSAGRRWYPDVWDLPGGHVEEGEDPKESLVRELREELGITASEPSSPPMHEIRTATFDMQIWLVDRWTGTPVNAAPDEHDAVAWFETSDLDSLRLAHESYLSTLTAVLVT
jgi:8-oxo-dGTP diphosphatase